MKNRIGRIIIVIGVLHGLLGLVKFSGSFTAMIAEGVFNTGAGSERGWAIWFTVAGPVFILLGLSLRSLEQHQIQIPNAIGWGLSILAVIGGIFIPVSGFWALLLPGILILRQKK
ncbi:MAG: DUF6463 family protein [Bacteroidota bacterium]